jgi:hypothetical protein
VVISRQARWLMVVTGLATLFAVLLLPVPFESTHLTEAIENAAHAPAFGLVALASLYLLRVDVPIQRTDYGGQFLRAFLVSAALGGITEIAQFATTRDPSWLDFLTDCLGAITALAGVAICRDRRNPLLWLVVIACATYVAAPVLWSSAAYVNRRSSLPALIDINSRLGRYFIESTDNRLNFDSNDRSMLAEPLPGPWPALSVVEVWPDWSAFTALTIEVSNPGRDPLTLQLRVNDRLHNHQYGDRFNATFLIEAGAHESLRVPLNQIRAAPAGRAMDMTHLNSIVLFQDGSQPVYAYKLYGIRLEQ